jgi:hypothetical protein
MDVKNGGPKNNRIIYSENPLICSNKDEPREL